MYDLNYAILNNKVNISSFLRITVEAEIDAIKLYEKIASIIGPDNPAYEIFTHIIEEEMEHVGEFEEMAERYNKTYRDKVTEGREQSASL